MFVRVNTFVDGKRSRRFRQKSVSEIVVCFPSSKQIWHPSSLKHKRPYQCDFIQAGRCTAGSTVFFVSVNAKHTKRIGLFEMSKDDREGSRHSYAVRCHRKMLLFPMETKVILLTMQSVLTFNHLEHISPSQDIILKILWKGMKTIPSHKGKPAIKGTSVIKGNSDIKEALP